MSPFEFVVRRPVPTVVGSLLLILFGITAAMGLPVRETPNVSAPIVTVTTTWFGADPALMETDVTEILERQLNGIEGVRVITSNSQDQTSIVTVEFELGRELEEAANDVRSRVSRARKDLPDDVEEPIVEKADADSQPVVFVRIDAPGRSMLELTELADTLVRERLASIQGVGNVQIYGEQKYAIRVELIPEALVARNLTVTDVQNALADQNVDAPAGRVEGNLTELGIRLDAALATVDQFKELVIAQDGASIVRLGDVADVRMGAENERATARSDGQPTVTVAVLPTSQANIIDVSDEIQERLPQIRDDLPPNTSISVSYDRTMPVRASLEEVEETLVIAFLLVVAVIFAFLRDWRSTLVPAIAIPVSLIGTFSFLYLAGFSINVFTLFGLVLAIGLVVDDAIVVVENVFRQVEAGKPSMEAAIEGTRQITFAVIATTIVLIAVFVPVIFAGGTTGRLFVEFGSTVAVSVGISAFVALTLTPTLAARLLRPIGTPGPIYRATGVVLDGISSLFAGSLTLAVRLWPVTLATVLAVMVCGGVAYKMVPAEFFPIEDRNLLLIRTLAPEGTSFDTMNKRMAELEPALMQAVPERRALLTRVGTGPGNAVGAGNQGTFILQLPPRDERERSQGEILNALKPVLGPVTAFMAIPTQLPTVGRGGGSPLQIVVQHSDFSAIAEALPRVVGALRKTEGLTGVNPDLKLNRPELVLRVDRDKAALAGVSIQDLGRTLQVLSGGRELSRFKRGSRQFPVIVQLGKEDRRTPDELLDVNVRNSSGQMVPLSDLVTPVEHAAAAARYHYDRSPSATISANLDGITLSEGIERGRAAVEAELGPGFRVALAGESRDFVESSASLTTVLLFAFVLVYLVLAAQFDSFSDPLAILVGAPIALAGAYICLWATGTPASFFAQVGMILLVGLVTKNGILIVEFAHQLREHDPSLDAWEAAQGAAKQRFRAILMTSVATIGGALPIALGFTAESRTPLGIVVVGGMVVATVLSLYATPVVWSLVATLSGRGKGVKAAVAAAVIAVAPEASAQSVDLGDALRASLESGLDAKVIDASAESDTAALRTSRAGVLPFGVATASAREAPDPLGTTIVSTVSAVATVTVPVVDVPAWDTLAADRRRIEAVSAAVDADQELVLLDVASAFVRAQRADMAVEAAEADVARDERVLAQAKRRVEVELVPEIDATRADLQLALDKTALYQARSERSVARLALTDRLGAAIGSEIELVDAAPIVPVGDVPKGADLDARVAAAIEGHPRVRALQASLQGAEADRRAAVADWLPTLTASGSAGTQVRSDIGPAPVLSIGATASWTWFAGTARTAWIESARAEETRAEWALADLQRSVEVDVRGAWMAAADAGEAMGVAESAVALAEREVQLAEDRWNQGVTDDLPVITAQSRLTTARRGRVDAVALYNLAVVRGFAAEGRLHELAD